MKIKFGAEKSTSNVKMYRPANSKEDLKPYIIWVNENNTNRIVQSTSGLAYESLAQDAMTDPIWISITDEGLKLSMLESAFLTKK